MSTASEIFEIHPQIKTNGHRGRPPHRRAGRRNQLPHLSTEHRALVALELVEGPARWPASRAAALVVRHSGFDGLIPSQVRIGKFSGGTRISMLLGAPA